MKSRARIIGIGNDYRRDDGAGREVARRLRHSSAPPDGEILEETGEGTSLLETWRGAERVILLDAVRSGAPAGTIHRIEAQTDPLPAFFSRRSTHAFGIAEAIELARALSQLPPSLVLFGIEGECFDAGVGLSPAVEKAVAEVSARVRQEIADVRKDPGKEDRHRA